MLNCLSDERTTSFRPMKSRRLRTLILVLLGLSVSIVPVRAHYALTSRRRFRRPFFLFPAQNTAANPTRQHAASRSVQSARVCPAESRADGRLRLAEAIVPRSRTLGRRRPIPSGHANLSMPRSPACAARPPPPVGSFRVRARSLRIRSTRTEFALEFGACQVNHHRYKGPSLMNGLIRASLGNPYAVTVMSLTLIILGVLSLTMIPIDILPVFKSPAVQTLTFYGGMSANSIANDITNRMERWTGQANGTPRQESRSIIGASIVRNYFQGDVDPNGALTQVNSLSLAVIPNLPPGTLPPVVLPFDPDGHDAGLRGGRRQRRPGQQRVGPLRRRPLRSPQHDHGDARRHRAGGLRRQGPRGHGLPRPPADAGPRASRRWT